MSLHPHLPDASTSGDNEFVHIRCLIANIHKQKNVARPPSTTPSLEMVLESPTSSDTEQSVTESERSEAVLGDELMRTPPPRAKSNSIAGSMLAPPKVHKRRRPSFLHLQLGPNEHEGPHSASAHLNVPRFTVTAPPGEQQRRFSHGFAFHGFALRRHSNTVCPMMTSRVTSVVITTVLLLNMIVYVVIVYSATFYEVMQRVNGMCALLFGKLHAWHSMLNKTKIVLLRRYFYY